MEVKSSACPLDCPDLCGLSVTVEHGRVIAVDGDHRSSFTNGLICGKVRKIPEHLYGPDRVLHPMMRKGPKGSGEWERLTWDAALDVITAKLERIRERHGAQALLPFHYGGSNGWLTDGALAERLWRRLGTSKLVKTYCSAAATEASRGLYGKMPGVALDDYEHANLIVLWGINPSATGIHLVPVINRARARGAKLVVIDPRATPLAHKADLYLPIRPGTDLPVALAVISALFDRGYADERFLAEHCEHVHALATLREPPIECLFVYNSNPAVTAPDQRELVEQLRREDLFVVVHEQVMTDTAQLADIVLPAPTFLEHRELRRGYGNMRMYDSPAVATPDGE